jgi:glutathione S-transferase
MLLYTCGVQKGGPPALHPCAKAARALDEAGHSYEIKTVPGYKLLFWTRGGDARDEVKRLSGQSDVPILVLDDGEVISGSGTIAAWAGSHPA